MDRRKKIKIVKIELKPRENEKLNESVSGADNKQWWMMITKNTLLFSTITRWLGAKG